MARRTYRSIATCDQCGSAKSGMECPAIVRFKGSWRALRRTAMYRTTTRSTRPGRATGCPCAPTAASAADAGTRVGGSRCPTMRSGVAGCAGTGSKCEIPPSISPCGLPLRAAMACRQPDRGIAPPCRRSLLPCSSAGSSRVKAAPDAPPGCASALAGRPEVQI